MTKWTEKEIEILIKKYSNIGIMELTKTLKKSFQTIKNKLKKLNLYRNKFKFTELQIQWLTENYPKLGSKESAKCLGVTEKEVRVKANRLNLFLNTETKCNLSKNRIIPQKAPEEQKINPNQFLNIATPEVAYILGLLWADGYINKNTNFITIIP